MRDATRGSKRTTSSPPATTHIPKRGATPLVDVLPSQIRFQLTHPMRGATNPESCPAPSPPYFNSRTLCKKAAIPLCISTHVSREGCDDIFCMVHYCREISIPAPRKERDRPAYTPGGSYYLFNSHTPYEVRSQCGAHCQVGLSFNSRTL